GHVPIARKLYRLLRKLLRGAVGPVRLTRAEFERWIIRRRESFERRDRLVLDHLNISVWPDNQGRREERVNVDDRAVDHPVAALILGTRRQRCQPVLNQFESR